MKRALATAVAVGLLAAACGGSGSSSTTAATTPATGAGPGVPAEASYFFNHRDVLDPAPPDLAGALRIGLSSTSSPTGKKADPAAPDLTLSLSLTYQGQAPGPDLVILDVIPWKVGDTEKGPGAFMTKLQRHGLVLKPGERGSVDVGVYLQRVGGSPATPSREPVPGVTPGPTLSTIAPRSLGEEGGLGRQALGGPATRAQETPTTSSTPLPEPSGGTTRPLPQGTPLGPTLPPSPGGPFDPKSGVQVIVVGAFAGPGVSSDAYKQVTLVPDDKFKGTYGQYRKIEQGIATAINLIL